MKELEIIDEGRDTFLVKNLLVSKQVPIDGYVHGDRAEHVLVHSSPASDMSLIGKHLCWALDDDGGDPTFIIGVVIDYRFYYGNGDDPDFLLCDVRFIHNTTLADIIFADKSTKGVVIEPCYDHIKVDKTQSPILVTRWKLNAIRISENVECDDE